MPANPLPERLKKHIVCAEGCTRRQGIIQKKQQEENSVKRLSILVLALVFSIAAALPVSAADFKVKGEYKFSYLGLWDTDFYPKSINHKNEDNFQAHQRVRLQIDAAVNENLKGVLQFEIGDSQWGYMPAGAAIGADGVNVKTKHAFIAFNIPQTDLLFQFGIMGVAMPSAVAGNPVLDDDVAATLIRYKFNDMISAVIAWTRLYDLDKNDLTLPNSPGNDELDAWALIIPINGDGWNITPWALFANAGRNTVCRVIDSRFPVPGSSPNRLDGLLSPAARTGLTYAPAFTYNSYLRKQADILAWWSGAAINISLLDPLIFKLDFIYGALDAQSSVLDRRGWYLAAAVDYKFDFMTTSLYGWYASGEDGSWKNGSEQMPLIQSGFRGSSFAFDGSQLLEGGGILRDRNSVEGKWAIALAFKDITFVQDLSHTLRFVYSRGTNDPDSRNITGIFRNPATFLKQRNIFMLGYLPDLRAQNIFMTTDDSLIEVNFDHTCMIYENLAAIIELGYAHLDIGKKTYINDKTVDAWKVGFGLRYTF
ncbi:conserved hypothetical protein [Desulfovibrionales bacterium]